MSTIEINKIVGAILVALLAVKSIDIIGDNLVHPETPEQVVYTASGEIAATPATEAEPKGPEPIAPLLASASVDAGKALTRRCASCHTFEKGGRNLIGPNLWDTVGRQIASVEGFNYSNALQNLEGDWDYQALNGFIASPRAYARGTAMGFAGLNSVEDRANLIAYMRTLSDDPVPLP